VRTYWRTGKFVIINIYNYFTPNKPPGETASTKIERNPSHSPVGMYFVGWI
jgi:hypothetical protein